MMLWSEKGTEGVRSNLKFILWTNPNAWHGLKRFRDGWNGLQYCLLKFGLKNFIWRQNSSAKIIRYSISLPRNCFISLKWIYVKSITLEVVILLVWRLKIWNMYHKISGFQQLCNVLALPPFAYQFAVVGFFAAFGSAFANLFAIRFWNRNAMTVVLIIKTNMLILLKIHTWHLRCLMSSAANVIHRH